MLSLLVMACTIWMQARIWKHYCITKSAPDQDRARRIDLKSKCIADFLPGGINA